VTWYGCPWPIRRGRRSARLHGADPSLTRDVDGTTLPVAGTFGFDPSHSSVGFVVRHLMVSKVRGRFGAFSGTLTVAEDPTASSVEVTIDAASFDSGDAGRDEHVRSADFLDVATFPEVTFRSTSVTSRGSEHYDVAGELTIKGTTVPVVLDAELEGVVADPWGNQRAIFSARTEIDREDFGLTWNQALETGGVMVGKKVTIEIEAQAVRT
jgi:polyisoprenoid-binding protein YceI